MAKKYEYLHYTEVILKENSCVTKQADSAKTHTGFFTRLLVAGGIFLALFGLSRLPLSGTDGFNKMVKAAITTDVLSLMNIDFGSGEKSEDYGKSELIESILKLIKDNAEKA